MGWRAAEWAGVRRTVSEVVSDMAAAAVAGDQCSLRACLLCGIVVLAIAQIRCAEVETSVKMVGQW